MQICSSFDMDSDGASPPDSTFETFSSTDMDLDFINELLDEGCWLETAAAEGSFLLPGPSTSSAVNDPCFPFVKSNSGQCSTNPNQEVDPERVEEFVETESQNRNAVETSTSLMQSKGFTVGGSDMARRWWIGPVTNPDPSSSVKERLKHAIRQLKESTKDKDVLIQIWVPIKKGDKHYLTTSDQPYLLDPKSTSLACYRNVSENYQFQAEEGSKDFIGLPGRVFLQKLPEWTPDVRFFRIEEYPRKNYAHQYHIGGSFAVPVFEQGSRTCLGVVEVVTTTQKINYRPELESVCKALEAVDLRSSENFCAPSVCCQESCQDAASEISEILESVCRNHRLPLALTWAPCFKQGKGGCRNFDEKYVTRISTVDSACFAANKEYSPFRVVCSEQYLFPGQGIVGRAFMMNKQCFASDVTAFSKTDYPFSHHAMMFGLHSAIAIPLRAMYDGSADFVLELFLPKDCRDPKEQQWMQDLLPIAIQQACRSLHVVMDKELEEDVNRKLAVASDGIINIEEPQKFVSSSLKKSSPEESSWIFNMMEPQQKGKGVNVSWDFLKEEPNEDFKVTTHGGDNTEKELHHKQVMTDFAQLQQQFDSKSGVESGKTSSFAGTHSSGSRKMGEKGRTKTERAISLEVLRQYFAGSLKDAAKSIGVCPTTLKRICRQHGITRWPSRKIKKVDRSLKKLQHVMDSVQGAGGAIQVGSFYSTFPELGSPNFSGGPLSSFQVNYASQLDLQPGNGMVSNGAVASKSPSSSCSLSSGSSICCSSGEKQHTKTINISSSGDASKGEGPTSLLKRTCSDAELHALNREEPKLARSRSHKILGDGPSLETLPSIPKGVGRDLRSGNIYRVKATYGEDKIRFSLQPNWGFKELQQEIAEHFKIDDVSKIDLKYLDDDNEWVLLTCDADLEECIDIYRFTHSHTIKISLHQTSQRQLGSSFGAEEPC